MELNSRQKEQQELGLCVEPVYRSYGRNSNCGRKLKSVEQGGDGFHCGNHLAMLRKRDAQREQWKRDSEENEERRQTLAKLIRELGLAGKAQPSIGSRNEIVVDAEFLKARFAEVWENGARSTYSQHNPYKGN